MSKEVDAVIELLVDRIEQGSRELAEKKRTVNSLCRESGKEPRFPDAELTGTAGSRVPMIRASQFYGKAPTTAAREYLELRDEAVPLDEILDAMVRGGFDFEAQGWSDATRLRNLGISLSKNSAMFHRLPNDTWGLLKWYPNVKPPKKATAKESGKPDVADQSAASADTSAGTDETETEAPEEKTKTANA